MAKKPKLTKIEREEIEILLGKGYSHHDIGRVLHRSHNSISYEIRKNSGEIGYNAQNAHQYATTRRKDTKKEWAKIDHEPELKAYIIEGLEKHWNPDEISGRMKREKKPWYASKTAIYEWLWSVQGQRYCVHLYSGRYHKKKRTKKTERVMIPDRVSIIKRPLGADNRTRYGHWENDTIVYRKGCSGGLSIGIERKSRLLVATRVTSMSTTEHMEVLKKDQGIYKTLSRTMDNGIENKQHKILDIPTYFCDPYSSWQKGSVENVNKMMRYFFPKGTNFRKVSQKRVDEAVSFINNKPRKILGYKTALEVARVCGMIREKENINRINLVPTVLIGG
jgi:transposase, IS30 family